MSKVDVEVNEVAEDEQELLELDEQMRKLANLILDRIEDDLSNNTLKFLDS